jgi:predicted transposase/invertase (TIGR01784 family)
LKYSYLDVKAEDQSGKSYIIEMQVLNVESFEKRILYNACKAYANQIGKGQDYHLLTDVIAITVTNFILFPERASTISKYKLRADDGDVYSDDLELVFAELPKFVQTETELETIIDKWLFFLKHADDLTLIPANLSSVAEIKHAFEIANRASWTKKELEEQERYEITIQDQRGAITLAEKKGETRVESVAINLLRSGMSVEQVAQITGLSAEQINQSHW